MSFSTKNFVWGAAAFIAVLLFSVPASAQTSRTLKATLQDASTGEPVAFATVSLTKKGATAPSKYILSGADGKATIEKVAAGTYTFKAELLGYKLYTTEITLKETLDLGVIKMDPDKQTLDAASVSAVGNPIVIKKDTVEYNASSFMTTDNDMLEDLLKKMPGMEVSEDGSVTYNGESITKITIDGKTFFLDDPQLATKNIPSKIVNKLKVINKKSDQAEFTGIDDGNEEKVIDLSIKPGMMNGVFGNVMAGGGHDLPENMGGAYGNGDTRYQGAGFMGRFTEKNQISLILNGNNTNNRGFNDLAGSMMQGMRGGGGGMGRGQGGWGMGNGITTSWMGGLNGNTNLFDDKMKLEGNYLYNGSKKEVEEISSKTTFLDDYNLLYDNNGRSSTKTDGHRVGMRIEHKFSDNTSILFQPQFNAGSGDFTEWSDFTTRRQVGESIDTTNKGFNSNIGNSNNWQTNGFLLLRQKLGAPGRTLSFNLRYNFKNTDMDGLNQSLTTTFDEGARRDSIINQRYDQNQKASSLSGRLTFTEPLGRGFYVEANYELSWNKNTSFKHTYDSGPGSVFEAGNHPFEKTGELLNDVYSNDVLNRYINQRAGANLMYQKEKIRLQVGLSANPTNTHNETNGKVYNNKVVNWAPEARLWADPNENTNIRVFYMGRSSQPSVSQLIAVPDNTNPLNLSFGNPYLKPYFSHNFRGEYRFTNKKTFTSLSVSLNGGIVSKPIVNATWYDNHGVQYSIPVNGKSSNNFGMRIFLNSPIAKSNFSIFSMTNVNYSSSSSFLGSRFDTSNYYCDGVFDYETFHKDIPDLNDSPLFALNKVQSTNIMERLRFTYKNNKMQLNAGGRTRMSKSWYTVASAQTKMTFSNQIDISANVTLPAGFGVDADMDYNWYNNYSSPQKDEYVLNAEITKLLFKSRATLAVKAYDIFNQSKNLSITDANNYHQETWNNTLGRYIIVSLTWRFGNFNNAMKNVRRGGPGGHGPGRGPMGPPPMM